MQLQHPTRNKSKGAYQSNTQRNFLRKKAFYHEGHSIKAIETIDTYMCKLRCKGAYEKKQGSTIPQRNTNNKQKNFSEMTGLNHYLSIKLLNVNDWISQLKDTNQLIGLKGRQRCAACKRCASLAMTQTWWNDRKTYSLQTETKSKKGSYS